GLNSECLTACAGRHFRPGFRITADRPYAAWMRHSSLHGWINGESGCGEPEKPPGEGGGKERRRPKRGWQKRHRKSRCQTAAFLLLYRFDTANHGHCLCRFIWSAAPSAMAY